MTDLAATALSGLLERSVHDGSLRWVAAVAAAAAGVCTIERDQTDVVTLETRGVKVGGMGLLQERERKRDR